MSGRVEPWKVLRRHQTMNIAVSSTRPITSKMRKNATKLLLLSSGILAALGGLGWSGLQVQPPPFPVVPPRSAALESIPLPRGLPAPNATDTTKTLWVNAVWFGERLCAAFNIEDVGYNVDVDTSLGAKGP
jgi:hypothetical protein